MAEAEGRERRRAKERLEREDGKIGEGYKETDANATSRDSKLQSRGTKCAGPGRAARGMVLLNTVSWLPRPDPGTARSGWRCRRTAADTGGAGGRQEEAVESAAAFI